MEGFFLRHDVKEPNPCLEATLYSEELPKSSILITSMLSQFLLHDTPTHATALSRPNCHRISYLAVASSELKNDDHDRWQSLGRNATSGLDSMENSSLGGGCLLYTSDAADE